MNKSINDLVVGGIRKFKEKLRAETSAVYSDIPLPEEDKEVTVYNVKSTQAISVLVLSLLWDLAFWQTEKLYRTLGHMAYAHNYQGHWSTLQIALENEEQSFEAIMQILIDQMGSHATFGLVKDNLVPKAKNRKPSIFYCFVIKDRNVGPTRPPRHVQRKRGYTDKGSCRRPHEFHGIPPYKETRVDLRQRVNHPLLREVRRIRESFSTVRDVRLRSSQKGE